MRVSQLAAVVYLSVLAVTYGSKALATETPHPIGHLPPHHKVDPELSEVIRKGAAITHRPYALLDPRTGEGHEENAKPIAPETVLTFPNGKKVTAGPYFEGLNVFERHINQLGYTMRAPNHETIQLSRIKINHGEHDQKRQDTAVSRDVSKIKIHPPAPAVKDAHATKLTRLPEIRRVLEHYTHAEPGKPAPQPKTFDGSRKWSDTWGWSNRFGAFIDTSLVVRGTSQTTTANGDASAGGYLFGHQLKIVHGDTNYITPKVGDLKGDASFYFLGYKLFSKDYNNTADLFYANEWSKGLDESTTIHFAIGPIPMAAKLGAQGDGGMEFRMDILPLHANVDIVPGIHSKVYIQIGVDVVVGGAGGGSDLVLLNDTLTVVGRLQLLVDQKGPYFISELSADDRLATLEGRVYAYVFVYVPRFGLPPWKRKQWDWNIFQIKGIQANGSLFNVETRQNLF